MPQIRLTKVANRQESPTEMVFWISEFAFLSISQSRNGSGERDRSDLCVALLILPSIGYYFVQFPGKLQTAAAARDTCLGS